MNEGREPQRILMTADTVGGVWTYAIELIRALPDIEFALATMGTPISTEQQAKASRLANVQLFSSDYALEWMDDPWEEVDRAGDWLLHIAQDFNPDVVHLNGYVHASLRWAAPVLVVAHSCVLSWCAAVKKCDAPHGYDEYRRRVREGLIAADAVAAPTAVMLNSLGHNYGWRGEGRVISNARDPQLFSPAEKRNVIFSAGRLWDDAKNLAALEAAAPDVRWPIEVAGDALHPNGSELQFTNVRGLGKLPADQLVEHLATSAIYALPARYEPFGLSALEAALSGCALVLGDVPTLREVWGDAAKFVDPNDHRGLAAALNALIDDESERESLAARARTRAMDFSPRRMADSYRAAYRDCVTPRAVEMAT
ncbi:MAG TPA: glycosyltransferase family 4 protein [Chthoniobacterales bacterium]|nr:glycosyltransferase family 4 protein [Chthoniobacterales bacterium]